MTDKINGNLNELITFLQYGTKLHIGVIFLEYYNNHLLHIQNRYTIHDSTLCREFKSRKGGFEKCFKCRQCAIKKAIETQNDFGGLCFNGIYEYIRPVIIDDHCVCIIFVGNIAENNKGIKILKSNLDSKAHLINTAQSNFDINMCRSVGMVIESFIQLVLRNTPSDALSKADSIIENIKNYVEHSLEYDISLSHISEFFHYNEQYLGRLFKKKSGMSFSEYLNHQRVNKSKILLRETRKTMIEISAQSGFNNVTYFNRVFRNIVGITPTQFRKNNKSGSEE